MTLAIMVMNMKELLMPIQLIQLIGNGVLSTLVFSAKEVTGNTFDENTGVYGWQQNLRSYRPENVLTLPHKDKWNTAESGKGTGSTETIKGRANLAWWGPSSTNSWLYLTI